MTPRPSAGADAERYVVSMDRQRARYAAAFGRCTDPERSLSAREVFKAAIIFERDAKHTPSRMKKAIEALKLAVFLLDPKAPA